MERKIGEIFEYNGEWYQCVEGGCCNCCDLLENGMCVSDFSLNGSCFGYPRKDKTNVLFKKLEKVGKPYNVGKKVFQLYNVFVKPYIFNTEFFTINTLDDSYISIKIKQTKEEMEENELIELLSEKVHNAWMKEKEAQGFSYGKEYDKEKKKHPDMLPYNELKEEVKEYDRVTVKAVLQAQRELSADANKLNLKPFSIEAAKAGKPVCTRDGRKARIICFDLEGAEYPIVAAIKPHNCDAESLSAYDEKGKYNHECESSNDLMMLTEKKEGWINVYKRRDTHICENECSVSTGITVYKSESEAKRYINKYKIYVNTIKISWEE